MRLEHLRYRFPGGSPFELGPLDIEGPDDQPWLILGPAGSGKSTLLRILGGVLEPQGGYFEGGRPAESAYLPQRPERVLLGRNLAEDLCGDLRPGQATRKRLRTALAEVGLHGLPLSRRSSELSAGERRRLSLALLEFAAPRDWALDEPDAGLDRPGRQQLAGWLRNRAPGRRIWIATHRYELYRELAGFLVVLDQGRVVRVGDPAEVVATQEVRDVLSGDAV